MRIPTTALRPISAVRVPHGDSQKRKVVRHQDDVSVSALAEGTRMAVLPDLFILLSKFHLGTMPLVEPNTLLATFGLGLWVILNAVEVQFALQLVVGGPARCIKHASVQRLDDGATGLGIMGAIVKPALSGKRLDIGEGCRHPVAGIPQTQLAHARRIEQQSTAGQQD